MITKGFIKKGEYFDSVSLMIVSKNIKNIEGVEDSTVVMATKENINILKNSGLYVSDFENCSESDMLVSIKAENIDVANKCLHEIELQLISLRKKSSNNEKANPKSIDFAKRQIPDINIALISINGKFAAKEAMKSLNMGLHVMLFSDNVSIEDELILKQLAVSKGLLMMGPDCGTAIINGVPFAFSNVVNKGNIGIVAASGTGLQEVSSLISEFGGGISQAIGTGGRDVKKEIGGLMFIQAMEALNSDPETKVIVLVSKPPHPEVLQKISAEVLKISKPVIGFFIGADPGIVRRAGAIPGRSLEETARLAVSISKNEELDAYAAKHKERESQIMQMSGEIATKCKGKYLRGLFSGGTLCDEAQLIMRDIIGNTFSNTPIAEGFKLADAMISKENTILDLGDDEFTAGRPHPMIDFSLRCNRIIEESKNPEVAVIMFDLVLGYGSNLNPLEDLLPALDKANEINPALFFICSITGTVNDPQGKTFIVNKLSEKGIIVMQSNVESAMLAGNIIKNLNN
jgi:succinyl-CoA synthetase alpha subunit